MSKIHLYPFVSSLHRTWDSCGDSIFGIGALPVAKKPCRNNILFIL